jgi:dTDP-4-dehydrorhamnose 3,5-epimerase
MGELSFDPGASSIAGVLVHPLADIADERGAVLHVMRCDSPLFTGFGEVYCSLTLPGAVKAWKQHVRQTQHLAVPVGSLRLVLVDHRADSPTHGAVEQHVLGRPHGYALWRIPPGLWYGFQAIGNEPALIVNVTDTPHDADESRRLPAQEGPVRFDWGSHPTAG